MPRERDTQQLKETGREQSPVTCPETLNAGRAVDEFLWKGDRHATPIQRAGLALFGLMYLTMASVAVVLIFTQDNWYGRAFGIVSGLLAGLGVFDL